MRGKKITWMENSGLWQGGMSCEGQRAAAPRAHGGGALLLRAQVGRSLGEDNFDAFGPGVDGGSPPTDGAWSERSAGSQRHPWVTEP